MGEKDLEPASPGAARLQMLQVIAAQYETLLGAITDHRQALQASTHNFADKVMRLAEGALKDAQEEAAEALATSEAKATDYLAKGEDLACHYGHALVVIGSLRRLAEISRAKGRDKYDACIYCARHKSMGHLDGCALVEAEKMLATIDPQTERSDVRPSSGGSNPSSPKTEGEGTPSPAPNGGDRG